jgi:hypothetical protein
MANDLNSEFTVILSSASSAILSLDPDHPARPDLDELIDSVHRCACKCADLLVFASRHGVQPSRASLAAVMQL